MRNGSSTGRNKKRKTSPSSDSSQGPSHKKQSRHSTDQEPNETVDAIISIIQDALKVAAACTSTLPVVGSVLPAVQELVDRIKDTRANVRDKQHALEEIEDLIKTIQSIGVSAHTELNTLPETEKQRALDAIGDSKSLDTQMNAIVTDLNNLKISVQQRPKRSAVKRFLYSPQDQRFIEDVREKISKIKENLQIRVQAEITCILATIMKNAQKQTALLTSLERRQREQADIDVLENFERATTASYRSRYIEEKASLHPGTRERIINEILQWAKHSNQTKRVQVIYGPAGVGKSAIAQAVAKALADDGLLGASFFFQRGDAECSNPYLLFPTIAYQLADSRPEMMTTIVSAVKEYIRHGQSQGISHQERYLFANILHACVDNEVPLVLVVDGVDECSNDQPELVQGILQFLCEAAADIPTLRILIATRPESYITSSLPARDCTSAIVVNLWDVAPDEIDGDIEMYIQAELDQRAQKGNFILLRERPNAVAELTKLAAGLFIYARAVTRALLNDEYGAVDILDCLTSSDVANAPRDTHERLDKLYSTILDIAFRRFAGNKTRIERIQQVLAWIALYNLSFTALELESVVRIPLHITQDVVNRLRSVLIVDDEITPSTLIQACHASFPQFLMDPARCTDPAFLVDPPSGHALIAISLLDLLARDDVDSLRDADGDIPPMWEYARHYWDKHLVQARYTHELERSLRGFVETHLEDWLRLVEPWGASDWHKALMTNYCAKVRNWYEENGPDDGLVPMLDEILDRRVKEIAAEANQLPGTFDWNWGHIKAWVMDRYPREAEQASVSNSRTKHP